MSEMKKVRLIYSRSWDYRCTVCNSEMTLVTADDELNTEGLTCPYEECENYGIVLEIPQETYAVGVLGGIAE